MNLAKLKHVHFTGIKGVGMAALALYFQDMGIMVSGSDVDETFVTDETLKKRKVEWNVGFGKRNLSPKPDLLITTAAHGGLSNREVVYANKLKIPVLTYAEALAEVSKSKECITVCGVGGKTTTSSMIAVVMDTAGADPSYVIGVGDIYPLGSAGRYKKNSRIFICEADEYAISPGVDNRAKFSLLSPKVIVATNLEHDHPDIYKDIEATKKVFLEFFAKIPKYGLLVVNSDNKNLSGILPSLKVPLVTFGFTEKPDYQVKSVTIKNQKTHFDLYNRKSRKLMRGLQINIPGEFNVLNATAAAIVADFYKVPEEKIREGLARYLGCRRRFEEVLHYNGAVFIDDYAHHPTEIQLVLKSARQYLRGRRIIAIFQPHTYSRTKALFSQFSRSFDNADIVGFMDIYSSAREKKDNSVSSKMLAETTRKNKENSFYLGGHNSALSWIKKNVKIGDVVLTMGAGDIFHLYEYLKREAGSE
jgi:UDP-N-acetylmuramate--alanine ligase